MSSQDVADIERDALPAGKKAWLLVQPFGQSEFALAAYLQPDQSSTEVRRGSLVRVSEGQSGKRWSAPGTLFQWAQVSIAGRDFNDIQGLQDRNRPFSLAGGFDDTELISLVRFLRNSAAVERWLISSISRETDGSVRVTLGADAASPVQMVTLKMQGADWVVISAIKGRA